MAGKPERGDFYKCPHGLRQSREPFPATVYYENAEGKRLYPWDQRDLPKTYTDQGYQRFEVSNFERSRFEKCTRAQMNAEANQSRDQEQRQYEAERDRNHRELRAMSKGMDSFHREIVEEAIRSESNEYSRQHDSEFRIGPD
jgi:hypothetical protein